MKQLLFLVTITSCIFISCKKLSVEPELDSLYIKGRLFLTDTITQNKLLSPLGNKKVLLCNNSIDSVNYLYSDSTDKDGYFSFPIIAADLGKKLIVRYNDTMNTFYYTANATAQSGNVTVVLNAVFDENKTNGFTMKVKDNVGERVATATITLFTNKNAAIANDTLAAVQKFTTDMYGRFYKLNIPAGTYYLNATKNIGTSTYQQNQKAIAITVAGILRDSILLAPTTSLNQYGVTVTLVDMYGGAVSGASAYIFTNKTFALTNDPTAAVYTYTTDNSGTFTQKNLPAGVYYLSAVKKAGSPPVQISTLAQQFTMTTTGDFIGKYTLLP